ncbi:MAG TPA: TolC family protein [Gemmatimonadota bacterium]|nr:TolC family protein [Gemmatimonadota bacterium]
MKSFARIPVWLAGISFGLLILPGPVVGQEKDSFSDLAGLLARARAENPRIAAAERAVEAARARAEAAGIPPDPMIGLGLVNALVSDPLSSRDFMTMRMVEVGQRFPYPGKLALDEEIAAWEVAAADAERRVVELEVVSEVKRAYYELAFLDRSREIVDRNRSLLDDFASVTQVRYGVGTGSQQDVLKAQVEHIRLGDELIGLSERRAAVQADLNALLDRPSSIPLEGPYLSESVVEAAIPEPGQEVRFTAVALEDAGGPSGPIPALDELQRRAEEGNPRIQAHLAQIRAQEARAELAGKAALPDLDVSFGYGQRSNREDMLSVWLSVPVPVFKGRKQDALEAGERYELASLEESHHGMVNEIRAEVAGIHASLVRTRNQLALLQDGILPQARASLESATAGYPVATVDFLTVIDNQATLFRHELDYHRLLTAFAADLAALERVVGEEVLR